MPVRWEQVPEPEQSDEPVEVGHEGWRVYSGTVGTVQAKGDGTACN